MKDNIFKTIQDNALYAKKRDHKIDITDVAINKIPRVQFKGFSDKDDEYIYENAKDLFNECVEELDENSTEKEIYTAALTFLARASEVGLYYR